MKHILILVLFAVSCVSAARADIVLLSENFDDVAALPGAGWAAVNRSAPLGATDWFQGNSGIFAAHQGAAAAYVAANFLSAGSGGNISNWLITPELPLGGYFSYSFYTRTEAGSPFADRLEVRLSFSGASIDVGASDVSVGDFKMLLLTVNPSLLVPGYPEDWQRGAATVTGFPMGTTGRIAFRYFVPDTSANGNYIGIDSVQVTTRSPVVPEPGTLALLCLGVAALTLRKGLSR